MKSDLIEIGHNIRKYRERANMSQDELAKKLGYKTRSSIALIESGEREMPYTKIQAAASALYTTVPNILGLDKIEFDMMCDEISKQDIESKEKIYRIIEELNTLSDEKLELVYNLISNLKG